VIMICGSLSPWHGATSGFGWRRQPPDMEGNCEYIQQAVADSRQGVILEAWRLGERLTTPHRRTQDLGIGGLL